MASEAETFELFGRAAFLAQLFENNMVTLIMTMRGGVGQKFKSRPEAQSYIDRLHRDNLGPLKGRLGKLTRIGEEVDQMLEHAITGRNRLIHHFFAVHGDNLGTDKGRDLVCADIHQCCAAIRHANDNVIAHIEFLHGELRKAGLMKDRQTLP